MSSTSGGGIWGSRHCGNTITIKVDKGDLKQSKKKKIKREKGSSVNIDTYLRKIWDMY